MKKLLVLFLMIPFMMGLFFLDHTPPQSIIIIDPGHGGADPGATIGAIREDELNLKIAINLGKHLENQGYSIIFTRDGDYDLSTDPNNKKRSDIKKRVELINSSNCLCYISIHMNIFSSSIYSGAQVFYSTVNPASYQLAYTIQNSLCTYLGNTKRECAANENIFLLNKTTKIGALIECGFLSNDRERNLLLTEEYQNKVALAICYGVNNYLSLV